MTKQKLNLSINLGEIRYLEVPDMIDYNQLMTQKLKTNRKRLEKSNRLDEIHQYTEVFAVTDRKTRHVKIP